jgi:hypothetical protein
MTTNSGGRLWATILLAVLGTYLAIVLLLGTRVFGLDLRLRAMVPLLLVFYLVLAFGLRALDRRALVSRATFVNIAAATGSILLSLLAMDLIYTVYQNATAPGDRHVSLTYARNGDVHPWYGELYPRTYYPTAGNFRVYKPGVTVRAETFGEFYRPAMKASRTLTDSVLQWRRIDYVIDRHGFRDTTPRDSARVVVLGDSFAFGYAIADDLLWVNRFESAIGQPVYNLGISSTGPRPQVDLLRYVLEDAPAPPIDHLLWVLFEGNDLENSHAERRDPPPATGGKARLVQGTVLEVVARFPETIRRQSVLHQWRTGRLVFRAPGGATSLLDHYQADGVPLEFPLYHSARHGYRLFNPQDIDRAARPADYVADHPNRPRIERLFDTMRELSEQYGFTVTLVLAPSAARLYGAEFGIEPAPTDTPHFLNFLTAQANRVDFAVVDLLSVLTDSSRHELLYFRDDHHWNERGNEVVAGYLTDWWAGQGPAPPSP